MSFNITEELKNKYIKTGYETTKDCLPKILEGMK